MKPLPSLLSLFGSPYADAPGKPPHRPLSRRKLARLQYREVPSFTDLLPWTEYLPDDRAFLLEDGYSVGAVLELTPVGCEARPAAFMEKLHQGLFGLLSDLTEVDPDPWVVQVYVQDETDLRPIAQALRAYIPEEIRETDLTRHWLEVMTEHLLATARPGGIFEDTVVTKTRWGALLRRTRLVVYRRFKHESQPFEETLAQLHDTVGRIRAALTEAGVTSIVADGEHVYHWLLHWFNPRPAVCDGDGTRLSDVAPYPGDTALPFGHDFAEMLTLSVPTSDTEANVWRFDGMAHTAVSVQALRRVPEIGLLTAERTLGDQVYAVFDRLPPGTVMAMTLIAKPQDALRAHVANIKSASVGDGAEAVLAHQNATAVELQMARHDRLIPTYLSFYVRAEDDAALRPAVNRVESLLLQNGLQSVGRAAETLACDAWLLNLPMNFDASLDKRKRRSRLTFATHVASLLPVYGRSRGTGHPGSLFFNRGGEPLSFDAIAQQDRKNNGHMLLVGPSGAGKSAAVVYLLMQALAVWRPRIYLIEAGKSFTLVSEYLRAHDVSVHSVTMAPGADVSLPPFAGALSLLDPTADLATVAAEDLDDEEERPPQQPHDQAEKEAGEEKRDLLGEMEIAARTMITGGDPKEEAKLSRADRTVIRRAILAAAQTVRDAGRAQVLTEDVAEALRRAGQDATLDPRRRERAVDMADAMLLFCSGLAGHFFNREGTHWPDVDVTHLELGILARDGYEDQLTVAYMALMNHIHAQVEARQAERRPTLVITDEGHIITTNPLLAPYVIKITKMWRKWGAWYWIATQNLADFPDASRRMLNMIEWWVCLSMPKDEVDQIARFKDLTEEQRQMLLSARKEPGKYTEGVVLTESFQALFRNVPPAITLALAQTEKEEKAARADIMREQGCTEVEAAVRIAAQIERQRAGLEADVQ